MSRRHPAMPLAETPEKGRVCWSCQHCYFTQAESGYSEYTPGSEFALECLKRYWTLDTYYGSMDDMRKCLISAETCADFQLHESIAKAEGRS